MITFLIMFVFLLRRFSGTCLPATTMRPCTLTPGSSNLTGSWRKESQSEPTTQRSESTCDLIISFFYYIDIILRYDYAEFSSIDIFKSVYFLHFSFIGFGVGRRRCVGQQMARIRMFLYTTCLLQKFKIEVPKDTSLPSHDPRALLSESPVILPPPMQYCFVEC